jgi:demethylmenaquinone methyltransferase/2-methoxy-6-polyprenyl-1,4-benzoquinol methylase
MIIDKSKQSVSKMFNEIAPTYDILNHLLSFNADKRWRRKAVSYFINKNPQTILDVATGTGDMIVHIANCITAKIYGIDIADKMLQIAREKIKNKNIKNEIVLSLMPAEKLTFKNEYFDVVTVAFGVRNFENTEHSLNEIYRVLKNNGIFIVLEFIKPDSKINRFLLNMYLKNILPVIGRLISKNKYAYKYLHQSIENFYEEKSFVRKCQNTGFKLLKTKKFNLGLVAIFVFEK